MLENLPDLLLCKQGTSLHLFVRKLNSRTKPAIIWSKPWRFGQDSEH